MTLVATLAAELGVDADQLRDQLTAPAGAGVVDAIAPNYMTQDAAGRVGANFSGHIAAQGVDLPFGTTDPGNKPNMLDWYDPANPASILAQLDTSRRTNVGVYVQNLLTARVLDGAGTTRAALQAIDQKGIAGNPSAAIMRVIAAGLTRTLLDDSGHSDFVQGRDESLRIIRGQITAAGAVLNGAGFTSQRTPGGLAAGDYTLTWATPFSAACFVLAQIQTNHSSSFGEVVEVVNNSNVQARLWTGSGGTGGQGAIHDPDNGSGSVLFIAIGPT